MSYYSAVVNLLIFLIILYEIRYLIDSQLLINNFKVKHPVGRVIPSKLLGAVVIAGVIFIVAYLFVTRVLKIDGLLFSLFALISIPLYVNYKLIANHNITDKKKTIEEALDKLNTGDIIIFETPRNISSYFILIPVLVLNICHIGIVVREGNKIYMLDADGSDHYCEYSKRTKNGVVLTELVPRAKEYDDYYIIQTNLHKYIKRDDLYKFIGKYANKSYMEDNINCMTLVLLFLHELKLSVKNLFKTYPLFADYRMLMDKTIYKNPFEYDLWKLEI